MKLSLPGLGGIKDLLLAHGEKAVIAVVGLGVVMLVLRSLGRDHLPDDRQADDLQAAISQARNDVEGFSWERAVNEFPDQVKLQKPLEIKGETLVDVAAYRAENWQLGWDRPVVPPIVRRSDPVLLEALDVEATGGSGLLAFINEDIRRERVLAEQRAQAQRAAQQQKLQQQQAREDERGRGGRRGRDADREGELIDPEHPNRRPVVGGMGRGIGAQLQGDEEVRVAHWAVVVAKVPIKEQIKLYDDAFANALGYDPQHDMPRYLGYYVERAEVRPGIDDEQLDWQTVRVTNGKGQSFGSAVTEVSLYGRTADAGTTSASRPGVVTDWATGAQMPEPVDPRYLDPVLSFPLPPLVGREWGSEVTHSEIPLAIDSMNAMPGADAPTAETPEAPADTEPVDLFIGGGTGLGAGRPSMGFGAGRGGYPGGGIRSEPSFGYEAGGYGRAGYSGEGYAAAGPGGIASGVAPQVDNLLLRFFDFTVQPGKRYKYRFRLVLLDPNQSFESRFVSIDMLDKEALARVRAEKAKRRDSSRPPLRFTDWSKPSRIVSIPQAGSVRVVSARPANEQSYVDEPRTTLLVESFTQKERGKFMQAAKEFDFRRGFVANRESDAEVLVDSGRFIDTVKDFEFRTGITVVDMRGGDRLPGRGNLRPARVLLMDPAGQLYIQNELDDAEAIERHKAIFEEDPTAGGGQFFDGGRGYPGRGFPAGRGGT